ncbi:MAG: tyrosine-type recombinase/integrase [Candidatus Thiodiazotropha taylori]|uniref:Tyrosine-type recombinase/integrase n=1 Tax=Candidatus Thiodiazotropha taylori TaxID=2792791 RepID=A0A9E4KC19_9GAMM|nr:tyrosine-type recombinase/integrase [Candidatus Thiodiazotropha taylori]MCW4256366.1 tyrosine-type recombinase/integrase [Candidatus Thiodiazotropha taylori]
MKNENAQALALVQTREIVLPEKDAALFREMLGAWATRRLGALRHRPSSVNRDVSILLDMARYTCQPPWHWTEDNFEAWCYEIGVIRQLAVTSQRHYQGTIRTFLGYLTENVRFRNEVRRLYGVDLVQICHAENCIPHVIENERTKERRALTHAEITDLFARLDDEILQAGRFSSKDFRPLQRDKALFFTIYAAGLRVSEARGLDMASFQPNPAIPKFGRFGFVSVWGKGTRGSGKRHRLVPVTHAGLPPLLEWYCEAIRPQFLTNSAPDEQALFLSERGRRMALSTIESRFQHLMAVAGLEGQYLVPHCLRHSSVTHEALRVSLEANRLKHGHTYAATTQSYMHVPDEFVNEEITRAISNQLDSLMQRDDDDND